MCLLKVQVEREINGLVMGKPEHKESGARRRLAVISFTREQKKPLLVFYYIFIKYFYVPTTCKDELEAVEGTNKSCIVLSGPREDVISWSGRRVLAHVRL
jgi:hypothetical protein